jgi:hypothetical protein
MSAYAIGQNQQKPPQKHCCCEHIQQIANDIHYVTEGLRKLEKATPQIIEKMDESIKEMKNKLEQMKPPKETWKPKNQLNKNQPKQQNNKTGNKQK